MNYVERMLDGMHSALSLNAATLSGAIDIVVVPQEDGSLRSTPFHVRFGKMQLLNSAEKIVSLEVNDSPTSLKMKLGAAGEAFFVQETQEAVPPSLVTSPIGSPPATPHLTRREQSNRGVGVEIQTLTSKLEELNRIQLQPQQAAAPISSTPSAEMPDHVLVPPVKTAPVLLPSTELRSSTEELPTPELWNPPTKSPISSQLRTSTDELEYSAPISSSPSVPAVHHSENEVPQYQVSWGWGSLPTLNKLDGDHSEPPSDDEDVNKLVELSKPQLSDLPNPSGIGTTPPEEKQKTVAMDIKLKEAKDIEMKEKEGYTSDGESRTGSWTGKVGSMFRIFKGNTVEPQYLVRTDHKQPEEEEEKRSLKDSSEEAFSSESTSKELGDVVSLNDDIAPPDLAESYDSNPMQGIDTQKFSSMVQLSRCAHLLGPTVRVIQKGSKEDKIFQDNRVRYEDVCSNPDVTFNPDLLFKFQDKLYPWSIAGPIMVSILVFHKPLSESVISRMERAHIDRIKLQEKKGWSSWLWRSKASSERSAKPEVVDKPNLEPGVGIHLLKSLRPTSEQLKSLKLHPGPNHIRFSVSSTLQGTREVRSTIYLWDPNIKIVISDIDGTITRSDVFGQILPIMGKDWSHSGVAQLYSNISANNYQILYLTSRPIGQANITRGFISTLKQGDIRLPLGPVFMSPNRLLSSLNQEVILRKPEEFKIACLKDIKTLFPRDSQPFYAGFGNRPTDAISYRTVGVSSGKIFTINYIGEISTVNYTYKKTFSNLNELVNAMFPSRSRDSQAPDEEWNYWNYWKAPIDLPELGPGVG